jgi:hypothetical protein
MTEQTKRALLELAYALSQDKNARQQLAPYGDLPEHLHDAVIDLMANGDL